MRRDLFQKLLAVLGLGSKAASASAFPFGMIWRGAVTGLVVVVAGASLLSCGTSPTSNAVNTTAPAITAQPSNQSVTAGQTATFSVTATGTAPLSYQWAKKGTNISGATSASYTTPATTSADNGATFTVVVSNPAGSATSNAATLTVNAAPTAPTITTQPANQTVTAGQTATFSVTATGTAPLSYQWAKNGTNISGATSASYTTPATTSADNGATFTVVVSNSVGSITSTAATLTVTSGSSSPAVVTYQYNNARTGLDANETTLTPSNVTVSQFGKLFSHSVDGQLWAQPLYVANVAITGQGNHNVVIVATENDTVYAFDADNNTGANANPLWHANLLDAAHGATAGESPFTGSLASCTAFSVGVTSTPVIDTTGGTIYVEAKSMTSSSYFQRLHALDIATGNEKSFGPALITATVSGTGDGSSGGNLEFDPYMHLNRPALLEVNGTVYVAFASHCDTKPFHGWIFGYDAATLAKKSVLISTPNGSDGGFWMSGNGPTADANGNIFIVSGNGTFSQGTPPEWGDTIMKLNSSLSVLDYFTPFDQASMDDNDDDLGSGGIVLLPDQSGAHPHLLVEAGKGSKPYLVDRDQLTTNNSHYCSGCSSNPEIVQESTYTVIGPMYSSPAYFNGAVYFGPISDVLKSIPLVNGLFDFANITSSPVTFNFPGATPTISANGTSNGIVWAIDSSPSGTGGAAILHAFKASNVSTELWNSTQAANNRDQAGGAIKFTVPFVANGKVYVGTASEVDVYGLF